MCRLAACRLISSANLLRSAPSFDPRNYGCRTLEELVRKQRYLVVKEAPDGDGNVHLHVRALTLP